MTVNHALGSTAGTSAIGPLRVSRVNPRYFTALSGAGERAVYLTGSHIWNNFHDGMGPGAECAATPERFDYDVYVAFLAERGHNFIRLWRWEQIRSQAAGGQYHLCMAPQPWVRSGPGLGRDGNPRFDLSRLDDAYFRRLRDRVAAAGERGIYVGVMLFDGWALHLSPSSDNVEGHPFHADNNVNGVAIRSIRDHQELPLDPPVQSIQEAYIRAVVDAVHDLPNVLYEVANESSGGGSVDAGFAHALGLAETPDWGNSTAWQYWVIDVVKSHEHASGYQPRPIGMTMQFPVAEQTCVNHPLYESAADWISPGYDDEIFARGGHPMAPGAPPSRWYVDPPAADGRKVVISDTDHYAPGKGDPLWAWKSFVRGHHTILMDFGLIGGMDPAASGFSGFESTRFAMGDTRRYADRMDLLATTPRGELATTGFALVNPGHEYLVLQPSERCEPLEVRLATGHYAVEWHSVVTRETRTAGEYIAERDGAVAFTPPFDRGAAVLYLRAVS